MSSQWYYKTRRGMAAGPLSLDELAFLASRGKLEASDLVAEQQSGPWLAAGSVAQLGFEAAPAELASREPTDGSVQASGPAPVPMPPLLPPSLSANMQACAEDAGRRWLVPSALALGAVLAVLLILMVLLYSSHQPPKVAGVPGQSGAHGDSLTAAPGTPAEHPSNDQQAPGEVGSSQPVASMPAPKQPPSAAPQEKAPPSVESRPPGANMPKAEAPPPNAEPFAGLESLAPAEPPPNRSGAFLQPIGGTITSSNGSQAPAPYDGRASGKRSEMVRRFGGSSETEEAVRRGLDWLAKHQGADGSWSLGGFARTAGCNCSAPGEPNSDTAATALALLPFLGAGELYQGSQYQMPSARALKWLIKDQRPDGSFGHMMAGNMYAHALATLAVCESLAMTSDVALKVPAQRAIDLIVSAQHESGGWRYEPGMPGDLSVTGWQVMALESARIAGLSVPSSTWQATSRFLDSLATDNDGSSYAYLPRSGGANPTMTAVGLLSRQYTGWEAKHAGLEKGMATLVQELPDASRPDIYYWYYGTLATHQRGGPAWLRWNGAMKPALLKLQVRSGHETGSWKPVADFDRSGGRLYMTALAVCCLEVYYRYMPLYRPRDKP